VDHRTENWPDALFQFTHPPVVAISTNTPDSNRPGEFTNFALTDFLSDVASSWKAFQNPIGPKVFPAVGWLATEDAKTFCHFNILALVLRQVNNRQFFYFFCFDELLNFLSYLQDF
jgi:hypothetical protein